MGRTRTRGIILEEDGSRTVNKVWRGERIFTRLGWVSQEDAESWLANEITRRKQAELRRGSHRPLFRECAARYLVEAKQKRSFEVIAWHVDLLLPYVGDLFLDQVCDETLQDFKDERLAGGIVIGDREPLSAASPTTVNRSLEVVRTILNRASRAWRMDGKPMLSIAPPLISMLEENRKPPHPLSWDEQDLFFPKLAPHLQEMALFGVNTGLRDDNICGFQWKWEVKIPEVGRSVFIIPAEEYKTKVPHVVILNNVAWSIIEARRKRLAEDDRADKNSDYVFTYRQPRGDPPVITDDRIETMHNSSWQRVRKEVGLPDVSPHSLRHTFATRLRLSGVSQEDRNALMGHGRSSMPEHYASADIGRMIKKANLVLNRKGTRTMLRVVNG
ncbi:MAG: tyrosine-type recombinase/integrase [Betaproteobacteria bacterium]|nr:tyrosine-type recombinase/integrase [Betaproteobacteria bacterium]